MMRAVALGSGRSIRRSLVPRRNILGPTSLAPDSLRDGESAGASPSLFPGQAEIATRSFSSVSLNNGLALIKVSNVGPHFNNQRRSLFGWGKAKDKAVENLNESAPVASESNLGGTGVAADATKHGDADQTVFSTGSDPVADQAPSSVESSPSFSPSFGSSPIQPEEEVLKAASAASDAASKLEGLDWSQDFSWYWPPDQVIELINYVQVTTGWSYAAVIASLTMCIRVVAFPLFVKAQQNSARMAHMKPEMDILKAKIDALGSQADSDTQMKAGLEMRALFKKFDCNPMKSLIVPLVQMPMFISMFVGLRKMPDYFPNELSTGGIWWFPDLTAADPMYIMPIASGIMFIGMVELGKEQMLANNRQQGEIFLNVFRAMGVVVTVATINFPAAIFCYWMPNNSVSALQAMAFNNPTFRRALGIWDLPAPVPGQEAKGIVETIQGAMTPSKAQSEEERIKLHNERMERRNTGRRVDAAGRKRRKGRRNNQS